MNFFFPPKTKISTMQHFAKKQNSILAFPREPPIPNFEM
jgi:hypothetical protein